MAKACYIGNNLYFCVPELCQKKRLRTQLLLVKWNSCLPKEKTLLIIHIQINFKNGITVQLYEDNLF